MLRRQHHDDEDEAPPEQAGAERAAGRVEFDNRGKAVWRWARDALLESTSILLKRLENTNLALEPTRKVPVLGQKSAAGPGARKPSPSRAGAPKPRREPLELSEPEALTSDSGGGFDPYNSGR
jgi:hypothetical protein